MMRWGLVAAAAVALLVSCTSGGGSDQGRSSAAASGDGSVAAAEQGQDLTPTTAAGLENILESSPSDLNAREQLVGYYFIKAALGPSAPEAIRDPNAPTVSRDRHLVWLIENSPAIELLATSPMGVVQPQPDVAGYSAAKAAWSNQLSQSATARVKGNAGVFFAQTFDSRAEGLLADAEAGDGANATWPGVLGDLYIHDARTSTAGSPAVQQAAADAVRELDRAWTASGGLNRDPRISELAKLSVVARLDDRATRYATILLQTFKAGAGQSPLTIGGPIHDGNMVMGEVALHKGDRVGAEEYLLKAGATPGSPQLNQFGPNFLLARDLLAAGSRDVVLKYCDEVARFWSDTKLAHWRAAIAAGQTPDFGDNLWN